MNDVALNITNTTKTFAGEGNGSWLARFRGNGQKKPVVALQDVSLQVQRREIFGILGPNGSGKSTLVGLAATLLIPDADHITIFGHDVQQRQRAIHRLHRRWYGADQRAKVDTDYLVLYLLVGTLVWRYLSIVFDAISEMIAWERWEGTIECTFMAPVSRLTHMLGQTIFSIVYGLLFSGVILVVVVLFFHLDLSQANLLGGALVLLAGSISFIGFGIMAAVLLLLFPERGAQMTHVVQAILLLVSGVYYPVTVMPRWVQALARLSPATYALEGIRQAILQGAPLATLLDTMGLLLAMGVLAIPAGVWIFSRAEHYAKRKGVLKRSG